MIGYSYTNDKAAASEFVRGRLQTGQSTNLKYLNPNDTDRLWGLTINSVGFRSIKPGEPYPEHDHPCKYMFSPINGRVLDEYQLLYIVKGHGMFSSQTLGFNKYIPVNEGDMILLFPGEWHNYRPDTACGCDEYWIGFQGDVIDSFISNGFFCRQKPILNVGIKEETVELYRRAIDIAVEQQTGYQQILAGIVNFILSMVYFADRNYRIKETDTENRVTKAKIIIAQEFQHIKPQDIAARLNMGYSSFRKMFRENTQVAPMQYILEFRIRKSKELLTETDMQIKEIAYRVGFENHEYFFTAFRKNSGVTPLYYRKVTQSRSLRTNKRQPDLCYE